MPRLKILCSVPGTGVRNPDDEPKTLAAPTDPLTEAFIASRPTDVAADLRRNVDRARLESSNMPFNRTHTPPPNTVPSPSSDALTDRIKKGRQS